MSICDRLRKLKNGLPEGVTLVAVSKFQPIDSIEEAYKTGQRAFGESRPQELAQKYEMLPKDVQWHFIGHLQTNKIKAIIPFVALIHSIDSLKLAEAVSQEALKAGRVVDVLLQVHIAREETKQGFGADEVGEVIESGAFEKFKGIRVVGLMGMATFTQDTELIEREFRVLAEINKKYGFETLSMGMSGDYDIAIRCGSNMIRVGSSIFGERK